MPANADITAVIASTKNFYAHNSFADQVINGRKLTAWMKKNGAVKPYSGGAVIREPLETDENDTVAFRTSMAQVDFTPQDEFSGADFTARALNGSTVLPWTEKWDNAGETVIDLWKAKLESTKKAMQRVLNNKMLTSDGTGANALAITGLPAIVSATGTYGGIARSGNTFWQAYVDSAGGPLTDDVIRLMSHTISRGLAGEGPDFHQTTLALYLAYEAMLVPGLRFENKKMADLGFPAQSLTWGNAAVVWDNDCDSGVWYGLNTKYLALRIHKDANFGMTDRLPSMQMVDGLFHYAYLAMTCNGCRYQGKMTGLTA
jgi:hypothetical protein